MSLLSDRQREDLHRSILEYLHSNGFAESFKSLSSDTGINHTPDPKSKYNGLLEKKWTSVIRLQKKIMDLENRNASLQEEVSLSPAKRAALQTDWVPRAPAAYTLTGHRDQVLRVAFHPSYNIIASASDDSTVKIWDWETGEFERTLKGHTRSVNDVDFDSKGNLLVTCSSDLFIKVWDTQNDWKNVKTMAGHDHTVSSARFMPGDHFIVSASRDRTIRVFDVSSTHLVRTISGHSDWVRYVEPSIDGKFLVSASNDQTARLWDSLTGEMKMEFRGHDHIIEIAVFAPAVAYPAIRELASLPASDRSTNPASYIATASRDKTIKLWDCQTGQMLRNLAGHDNWVRALVFHPSGKFLLSAGDDYTIRVWELSTGRCIKVVQAHGHFVTTLTWGRRAIATTEASANGSTTAKTADSAPKFVNVVATGSVDQTIKIWLP